MSTKYCFDGLRCSSSICNDHCIRKDIEAMTNTPTRPKDEYLEGIMRKETPAWAQPDKAGEVATPRTQEALRTFLQAHGGRLGEPLGITYLCRQLERELAALRNQLAQAQNEARASEKLCEIYFNIAKKFSTEEQIRAMRDQATSAEGEG